MNQSPAARKAGARKPQECTTILPKVNGPAFYPVPSREPAMNTPLATSSMVISSDGTKYRSIMTNSSSHDLSNLLFRPQEPTMYSPDRPDHQSVQLNRFGDDLDVPSLAEYMQQQEEYSNAQQQIGRSAGVSNVRPAPMQSQGANDRHNAVSSVSQTPTTFQVEQYNINNPRSVSQASPTVQVGQHNANAPRSVSQASAPVQTDRHNANVYSSVLPTSLPYSADQIALKTIWSQAGSVVNHRVHTLRQQEAGFHGVGSNYGTPPDGQTGHLSTLRTISPYDPYNRVNPEYDNRNIKTYFPVDSLARQMDYNEDEIAMEVHLRPMDMVAFPVVHVIDRARVFDNIVQDCRLCVSQYNKEGYGVLLNPQHLCLACVVAQHESKTQFRLVLNHIVLYRKWVQILKTSKYADSHSWARLDLEARIFWLLERKSFIEAEIDRFPEVELPRQNMEMAQTAQKMVKRLPEQKTERPKTRMEAKEYAWDYLKQIGKCVDPLDEMWHIDQYQELANDPVYQRAMQEQSRKRRYEQEQLAAEEMRKTKRARRNL